MKRVAVLLATIVLVALALTMRLERTAKPAGQAVFTPVESLEVAEATGTDTTGIVVQSCVEGPGGVRVVGRIDPNLAPAHVVVTGGSETVTGVRVGMAFLADSRPGSGAQVGDFAVVLPWAGQDSQFAVILADGGVGSLSNCPN